MSNVNRWNPRTGLVSLRDNMNRILEEGLGSIGGGGLSLAIDIYETDDAVIIETSPLMGIKADSIEVSITDDILTIKGETQDIHQDEARRYLRQERRFGGFSRSVNVPRAIKAEETTARFKDGILTITIPKADSARPQIIDVTTPGDDPA
ncbi:MAG: Hsp20/alpha crystallin family protein [Anaerolineae bacterium]|nr:Hsp20/alpha crystallin family protein [Anaerolineae bacterium]